MKSLDELRRENAALGDRISRLSAAILRISASLDLITVLRDLPGYVRSLGFSSDLMPSKTFQGTPMRHRGVAVFDLLPHYERAYGLRSVRVCNLGSGHGYSVREVVSAVERVTGARAYAS